MPLFQYQGRKAEGGIIKGRIEASSEDAVAEQLMSNDIMPIKISALAEKGKGGELGKLLKSLNQPRCVPLEELVFFSRQMQTLLRASVPIMQALNSLRDTTHNILLKETIGKLAESLDTGQDLTNAIKRHPKAFPKLYISMIQVGETTGNLPEAFGEITRFLERELETRTKIKAALRYPMFVITAITIAMFVMNIFVLPRFENIFTRLGSELPIQTIALMAISRFFTHYWPFILTGIAACIFGFRWYIATPAGRRVWDRYKLRLPVVGKIIFYALLSRFANSFAMVTRAGVPITEGMSSVESAVDNIFIAESIAAMRNGISRGDSLSKTAETVGLFPQMVLQMISVGEQTGMLDEMFAEVGEYYDRQVDYQLKNLSSSIEPIMLFFVGVMVLVLAMGVFLPMWDLGAAALKKH